MPFAATANEWMLVSMLTFLDFVKNPVKYRKPNAQKSAMVNVAKDERIASDLIGIQMRKK